MATDAPLDAPLQARFWWLLRNNEQLASSRLQGYLIHRFLKRRGVDSQLLLEPPFNVRYLPWSEAEVEQLLALVCNDVVVVQKLTDEKSLCLVKRLRAQGTPVVYVDCDFDPNNVVAFDCDAVICPSEELASYYRQHGMENVTFIPDSVEAWCEPAQIARRDAGWPTQHTGGRVPAGAQAEIRLCWVGNAKNWHSLEELLRLLEEEEFRDMGLITISDHPEADVRWSLQAVRDVVRVCDIGVVPTAPGFAQAVKSSNRVTLFMAEGLPVIAGRIASYEDVVRHGESGFLARDADEWRQALRALRDADLRRRMAVHAYEETRQRFAMEVVGERWLDVFRSVSTNSKPAAQPLAPAQSASLQQRLATQARIELSLQALRRGETRSAWNVLRSTLGAASRHPDIFRQWARAGAIIGRSRASALKHGARRGAGRIYRKLTNKQQLS